jgi:hypothetical protein
MYLTLVCFDISKNIIIPSLSLTALEFSSLEKEPAVTKSYKLEGLNSKQTRGFDLDKIM